MTVEWFAAIYERRLKTSGQANPVTPLRVDIGGERRGLRRRSKLLDDVYTARVLHRYISIGIDEDDAEQMAIRLADYTPFAQVWRLFNSNVSVMILTSRLPGPIN